MRRTKEVHVQLETGNISNGRRKNVEEIEIEDIYTAKHDEISSSDENGVSWKESPMRKISKRSNHFISKQENLEAKSFNTQNSSSISGPSASGVFANICVADLIKTFEPSHNIANKRHKKGDDIGSSQNQVGLVNIITKRECNMKNDFFHSYAKFYITFTTKCVVEYPN